MQGKKTNHAITWRSTRSVELTDLKNKTTYKKVRDIVESDLVFSPAQVTEHCIMWS